MYSVVIQKITNARADVKTFGIRVENFRSRSQLEKILIYNMNSENFQ